MHVFAFRAFTGLPLIPAVARDTVIIVMTTRITRSVALSVVFLVASAVAVAQPDSPVLIGEHPFDGEVAAEAISATVQSGFAPVGLEITVGESIVVLYAQADEQSVPNAWLLHEFDSINTLEEEMNGLLDNGWIPMDLSFSDGRVFAMFVDVGPEISGWRIHTELLSDTGQVEATIQRFQEDGLSLWGLSFDADRLWYLFLRETARSTPRGLNIQSYRNDVNEIQSGLTDQLNVGWLPWGLFIENDQAVTIVYTADVLFIPTE